MEHLKKEISEDKMKVLVHNIYNNNNKHFLLLRNISLDLPNTDHLEYQHSECFLYILC